VATSSTRADVDLVLSRLGLAGRFAAIVTIEDVRRGKPDPEIYEKAAARLGLAPAECGAIEDSTPGVASARSAGCYVAAVTTTHPASALRAAHEVHPHTVAAIASLLRRAG
jgi:beta-phosphoglucomutase-like phosphatase (HAD superfamily)